RAGVAVVAREPVRDVDAADRRVAAVGGARVAVVAEDRHARARPADAGVVHRAGVAVVASPDDRLEGAATGRAVAQPDPALAGRGAHGLRAARALPAHAGVGRAQVAVLARAADGHHDAAGEGVAHGGRARPGAAAALGARHAGAARAGVALGAGVPVVARR